VRFICDESGGESIDLVGFSWGTITSGLFAQHHASRIRRLALYAPLFGERNALWQKRIGCPDNPGVLADRFGAWRLVSLEDTLARWNDDLHGAEPSRFRDAEVAEILFDAQAANDPQSQDQTPRAFRCPNGALADLIEVFNGKPLYDPSTLTMPVLLVRGEQDTTATESDAKRLLDRVPGARYRAIPGGSHFLCIEKNRLALYEELRSFLT
jgi:pimeloyl-ACP methyl ester carboxylesterase